MPSRGPRRRLSGIVPSIAGRPVPRGRRGNVPVRVHVNGRLVEEREALVSVFDRGFLFGDGLFESMRAVGGTVFRLDRHLERLQNAAVLVGLDLGGVGTGLAAAVDEVIRDNRLGDARVRITVTRGRGRPGEYLEATGPPTVVIVAAPFSGLDARRHEEGVSVAVSSRRQIPPESLDPAIKSISRLSSVLARREASALGAFEALLLDGAGDLTEGTVSNLFITDRRRLLTPALPAGCLPGITRGAVIELAAGAGLEVREERLPAAILCRSDVVFLTNTSWEVLPVVRVDGRPVGDGRPGPVARDLLARYRDLVRRECVRE